MIEHIATEFSNKKHCECESKFSSPRGEQACECLRMLVVPGTTSERLRCRKLESNNLQKHMTILSTTEKCAQASPDQPTLRIRQKVRINQGNA